MAGNILQNASSIASLMGTELNSLVNGTFATASAAYDNTPATLGAMTGDFELVLATGTNMTANNACDLYLIPALDGTNYVDVTGPPPGCFVGSFIVQATTAGRYALLGVRLPPTNFKAYLKNGSGVNLSSSGSTLKMVPGYSKYT